MGQTGQGPAGEIAHRDIAGDQSHGHLVAEVGLEASGELHAAHRVDPQRRQREIGVEGGGRSAEDLRDPSRMWEWGDPDTLALVLADGLDWHGVAAVLDLEPAELDKSLARDQEVE